MDALDDIKFWSRQLSEHALFMHLGLEVPALKQQAGALHGDWEKARDALASVNDLGAAQAVVLAPTDNLADFKMSVLVDQADGHWVGWLYPLFIAHMLRELRYFVARVWYGGLPSDQTFYENLTFMREHAEFAAHLLDPSAKDLIAPAEKIADRFGALGGCCATLTPGLIELGRKAGKELDTYFTTQPVSAASGKSVIHPVLAEHVVREGQRFLLTMDELSAGG